MCTYFKVRCKLKMNKDPPKIEFSWGSLLFHFKVQHILHVLCTYFTYFELYFKVCAVAIAVVFMAIMYFQKTYFKNVLKARFINPYIVSINNLKNLEKKTLSRSGVKCRNILN